MIYDSEMRDALLDKMQGFLDGMVYSCEPDDDQCYGFAKCLKMMAKDLGADSDLYGVKDNNDSE